MISIAINAKELQLDLDKLSKGGTLILENTCKIDSDIYIPKNVTLKGPFSHTGCRGNNGVSCYEQMIHLSVSSKAKINLQAGSGIHGCLIIREGFRFPAKDTKEWKGTAVLVRPQNDDTFIFNSMILGFENAIVAKNSQRVNISNVNIDCINGVEVATCWDITRISDVHCWPFCTIGNGNFNETQLRGTAFNIHSGNDWTKLTNCFSWGYKNSYVIKDSNEVTIMGCGSDNQNIAGVTKNPGSIGFSIIGHCHNTKLIGCQAAASKKGVYIDTPDKVTMISEFSGWGFSDIGIETKAGTVTVSNSSIRDCKQDYKGKINIIGCTTIKVGIMDKIKAFIKKLFNKG